MPLENIVQPERININDTLRLRKFDYNYSVAFLWYQDEETVKMVDGESYKYDLEMLKQMYNYLDRKGELYFIEVLEDGRYKPIGDVTLCKDDLPIVIGNHVYRNHGIGKSVLNVLIQRAIELKFSCIKIREIYCFNIASQKLFESIGFEQFNKTKLGYSYIFKL